MCVWRFIQSKAHRRACCSVRRTAVCVCVCVCVCMCVCVCVSVYSYAFPSQRYIVDIWALTSPCPSFTTKLCAEWRRGLRRVDIYSKKGGGAFGLGESRIVNIVWMMMTATIIRSRLIMAIIHLNHSVGGGERVDGRLGLDTFIWQRPSAWVFQPPLKWLNIVSNSNI